MIENPTAQRLGALRLRGAPEVAPLWIETLPPEEALAEVRARAGPIFRLQEARLLFDAGQGEEATDALDRLTDLPPGLERLGDRLRRGGAAELVPAETEREQDVSRRIASKTLAELHVSQGDLATAVSMYREILDRDPSDATARNRLRELTSPRSGRAEVVLTRWLERVRLWRRALGV